MKQLMYVIILVLGLSMLVGCDQSLPVETPISTPDPTTEPTPDPTIEPTPEPTEEPVLTNDAYEGLVGVPVSALEEAIVTEGFEFSLYTMETVSLIKDKYFQVHFKEVIYQPVKNRVCIIFDYEDEDYERATYYMVGRKKGSLLTAQQLSFVVSNPTGEHGGCFTFMSEQTTYEILIGKIDKDDLNPTAHMEAVAVMTFTDKNYNQRHKLGTSTLAFGPSMDYTYDQIPSVSLDIVIEDAAQIIDSVVIKLFEESSERLLETHIVPSNLLKWESNRLVIHDYLIDDLAPYVDYRVKVYVTGFNGIETFTEVDLINQTFKSQNITYSKGFRRHGFFAETIRVEPGDTLTTIHYLAVNDQTIVSSSNQEPYTFFLKIYDTDDQMVYETPIDVTKNSIAVPSSYTLIDYKINIVTDRDDIELHEAVIIAPVPQLTLNDIENNILSGQVTFGQAEINFIAFLIYENLNDPHFDEVEITEFTTEGHFSVELSHHQVYQNANQVLVLFIINYGDPLNPQFSSRQVWIEIK
ncbi:MAG: hypothetical protein ACNA7K_06625 [Acholeplasmataceae bacterium]